LSALFLPFTDRGRATELQAVRVKAHLGLGPYDSTDPFQALPAVPARLVPCTALPLVIRRVLLDTDRCAWSAVGLGPSPVTAEELILLNPLHHANRRRASLMEEIVHIVLGHPRVRLRSADGKRWSRSYDPQVEDEAFNVGAACIIPYRWLFNCLQSGHYDAADISKSVRSSVDYVEYRIKRAGLYPLYRKRSGILGSGLSRS